MRAAIFLPLALAAALTLPAHAADDLMTIYRDALRSDPVLRQAQAARDAVQELRPQARSVLLPNISASAGYNWTARDGEDWDGTTYGLQLTQPIFRYSALVQLRQVDALASQADIEFAAAQQELILRVADRYFAVLDAESTLRLAEAEVAAIERQLQQAEQRFEVGLIAVTDVEEARARRDLARASLIAAQNQRESALEALRELTGREHQAVRNLPADIPLRQPDPADPQHWLDTAKAGNPRLQAIRRATEAAQYNVDVRRAERYPNLSLTASAMRSDTAQPGGPAVSGAVDTYTVGIQLQVPLYLGGRLSSQVREAQYRYTEAFEALQATHRNVLRAAADGYRSVESSLLRVRALQQALSSTQRALESVEAGFRAGTRTTVDVLNAQRERFRAEAEYAQATYDHLLSHLRLRQVAGLLDEDDLEAINALLR